MLPLLLLHQVLLRSSRLSFSLYTINLKLRRNLRSHKTVRAAVTRRVDYHPLRLLDFFRSFRPRGRMIHSHWRTARLKVRRQFSYHFARRGKDWYPTHFRTARRRIYVMAVARKIRRPLLDPARRRAALYFRRVLETRLAISIGRAKSRPFKIARRLFERRIISKWLARRRLMKAVWRNPWHRRRPPRPKTRQKLAAIARRRRRARFFKRKHSRYAFLLRRGYRRYRRQPPAHIRARALRLYLKIRRTRRHLISEIADILARYRLYLKYIRRRRSLTKRRYLRPPLFARERMDHLFVLLKSVRRRVVSKKKLRNPRKQWRPGFLKRRFLKKSGRFPRQYYFLRRRQNFDSPVPPFLSRLARLFKRYKIVLRKYEGTPLFENLAARYDALRKTLLKRHHYLIIKKKRSNLYFTVVNHVGEVTYSISVGRYVKKTLRRRNRKLRKNYTNYTPIIKMICSILRKKKIFRLRTAFKPSFIRTYVFRRIANTFLMRGVRIMNINYIPKMPHGRAPKNKKARRL